MPNLHHSINYIELPSSDIEATKQFYSAVFGWTFQDWGPDYVSFEGAGIDGGFDREATPASGGVLAVLYSASLEDSKAAVADAGGTVVRDIFEFPGGRRFHFTDPSGNELAVWATPAAD